MGVALLLGYLSIPVVLNLLSQHQVMNTSFNSLKIVNTYGAFGRYVHSPAYVSTTVQPVVPSACVRCRGCTVCIAALSRVGGLSEVTFHILVTVIVMPVFLVGLYILTLKLSI